MKINIEISREEIESAINLGSKAYRDVLEVKDDRKRLLVGLLGPAVASAATQIANAFINRDEDDDEDDEPQEPQEASTDSTSEAAA